MAEEKKKVSETLEHAYPKEEQPVQNNEQVEKLTKQIEDMKASFKEL